MFNEIQNEFDSKVREIATKNVIKKLEKQNVCANEISNAKFHELIKLEIDILKSDGKKVGSGIVGGIALTLLTGGLF